MADPMVLIVAVVIAALAFDYTNGWNDSANAIATVVSTRVLSPGRAVILAALLNFGGAFVSEEVAKTIGTGLVDPQFVSQAVVLASMIAAAMWVGTMTFIGMPISGSHSLIGSLIGAATMARGWEIVHFAGLKKVLIAMLLSPLLGLALGFLLMWALLWIIRRWGPGRVQGVFGKAQLASVSWMAWEHGSNDAQKVMGVITLALVAGGFQAQGDHSIPLWVKLACATAMGVGTAAGGWKVIRTLGSGLIKIQPIHGFAAETAASATLMTAAQLGVPVSTTHTITGAIMGVGATKRLSAVRWGLGGKILLAWVFTLPMTALISAATYRALNWMFGLV
ncbi:MAG: inorganic phosphate transporter [Planctomycetes bacterium]|nr:inorganic phosphate transporter [Planctomycetota bacterium]